MTGTIVEITSGASGAARHLTVTADVKDDLGITANTWNALFDRYVGEASEAIAEACGRVFAKETVSEQFRPVLPPDELMLTRWPVASITSVTEDADTPLTSSDYEVDKASGLLYRRSSDVRIAWQAEKVVVVYEAGYELPASAPLALQKAARALVRAQWLGRGRDPLVRSEEVPGVLRQDFWVGGIPGAPGGLPPDVEALIAPYRAARVF